MKWLVLGDKLNRERYEYLNQWICEFIEPSEVEFASCELNEMAQAIEDLEQSYDQIRVERPHREKLLSSVNEKTSMNHTLNAADALVKSHKRWWPRSTTYEGLVRLAANRFKNIDLNHSVLIVGTGTSARAAVGAFIRLGFTKINITDRAIEKGMKMLGDLEKSYFGVEFICTPLDELTLLAGNHQIMFNTTPNIESNPILKELYYFNYLIQEGIVIDVALSPLRPRLLEEAESINAQTIEGCELASWSDLVWMEMCLGYRADISKYLPGLREKFQDLSSVTKNVTSS